MGGRAGVLAAVVAAVLWIAPAALAAGERQTGSLVFTTSEPGAPTGSTLSMDWVNPDDPSAKPYAVSRFVVTYAPGTAIDTTAVPQCKATDAELELEGAAACPADSRLGGGTIVSDSGGSAGPFPRYIDNAVDQFNNQDEVVGVGQATNAPVIPGVTRTVTRTQISGTTYSTDFPAFPTGQPPDGYSALKSLRLAGQPYVLHGRAEMRTPRTCPPEGYWVNTVTLTYHDGVTQTVTSQSPCTPGT